ncbi:MAG: hypothetical protein ACFFB7_05640, partial [Candidatus Sifarchaeia archaeon]
MPREHDICSEPRIGSEAPSWWRKAVLSPAFPILLLPAEFTKAAMFKVANSPYCKQTRYCSMVAAQNVLEVVGGTKSRHLS